MKEPVRAISNVRAAPIVSGGSAGGEVSVSSLQRNFKSFFASKKAGQKASSSAGGALRLTNATTGQVPSVSIGQQ
jgi:hypothetical protein